MVHPCAQVYPYQKNSLIACSLGDEGSPIVHAPFSREYEDSLIAIASYTEGDCDESGSVAVAMNVRKFKGWIKRTCKLPYPHDLPNFAS